jgi:thioesterase domain-containing protein/acyl carrier protein
VAVVARVQEAGVRLVAYYVAEADGAVGPAGIREFLGTRLPDYLVPSAFVALSALPLTPSGKVDRSALPAPESPAGPIATDRRPPSATEQAIAAIWRDVLGLSSVGMHQGFFEVGGYSLAALRVFAQIESTLGVSLPLGTLFEAPTIADLARAVDRSKSSDGALKPRALVRIQEGIGPPLICVHTLSGDVLEYRNLARHLSPEQPVIGIQAVLDDRVDAVYGTLEATAAAYVTEIQRIQPEGPYYLCGWSSGGTLALEMAQQLLNAGAAVALLAIIDSAPYNVVVPHREAAVVRWARQIANIPAWIRDDLLVTSTADFLARTRHKLSVWRRRWFGGASAAKGFRDVIDFPRRAPAWEHFAETHFRAFREYVPKPYRGRVSVFTAPTHPLTWLNDPARVWRHLAQDVEVYPAAGTHFSIFHEPNVQVLAHRIGQAIEKARKSAASL